MNYTSPMYVVEQSDTFKAWLNDLRDFVHCGKRIIFLLNGGDKSTQRRDIKRAKEMAAELDED